MKWQHIIPGVMMMALLSACIATPPVAPSAVAPSATIVSEEPAQAVDDHDHAVGMPEELGDVEFPISCKSEAQAEFNHGMALLHSFWFAPSMQSFSAAAELDPDCAMAHWGTAMALLGNPFAWPPTAQALEDGWAAVERAMAASQKTEREEAYVAAIAAFYQDASTVDHRTRALAYTEAMAQLAGEYPEDTEATIFYALALNATALPSDKSYANQLQAVALLEQILVDQPNHPGVAHYLIHSNDYPALAEQGLDAALRYAGIAPSAPHAQHMPSHIFTRLGYWQESIESNIISAQAAQEEIQESHQQGAGSYNALHAMDYLMYAYLQLGQDGAAKELLDEIYAIEHLDVQNFAAAYAFAAMPSRYVVERGEWAEAATLSLHPPDLAWERFPQAESILVFARGLGAARNGEISAAREELARLEELQAALIQAKQEYWAIQTDIQIHEVAAWVAFAEGNHDEAVDLMHAAVAIEDSTEKHPVTPGPIAPARELLGEMLLELNNPTQALQEFEASQQIEPNRFRGLYNAARAAELGGELDKAHDFYTQLVALGETADSLRPELEIANEFLASH
jgi:hypothetical protein